MKYMLSILIPLLIAMGTFTACTQNDRNKSSEKRDYSVLEMMEVAFEGSYEKQEIKPLLEAVMKKYDYKVTEENRERVGSMLISLRKNSVIGVTEMDILKHMYQNGSGNIKIEEQAALSATMLELTK